MRREEESTAKGRGERGRREKRNGGRPPLPRSFIGGAPASGRAGADEIEMDRGLGPGDVV